MQTGEAHFTYPLPYEQAEAVCEKLIPFMLAA